MRRDAFARAKINLYLHVGAGRADGYHPISSLMVFADIGDRLVLTPADSFGFAVSGPFAAGLTSGSNLVVRARDAMLLRHGKGAAAFHLALDKQLPLAAGLGGGSADAAATLRLVNAALGEPASQADLAAIAADLGADVPACLAGASVIAGGRGDVLGPAPTLPLLPAVLVNNRVALPTAEVYRLFDEDGPREALDAPAPPSALETPIDVVAWLAGARNDLEGPALRRAPSVAEVLAALRGRPQTLLARMTGSGSTCFALCADGAAARALAGRLAAAHPSWWVASCRLGDKPSRARLR